MEISIEDIRKLCTERSFTRGIDYYRQGCIQDIEQFGSTITAYVSGASIYKVTIDIDSGSIKADCTCPYDWGGYCKHIVAVLFAFAGNKDVIEKKEEETVRTIENIFNGVTYEEIKTFLIKEFEKNPTLRKNFTIFFSGKDASNRSLYDYKEDISLLFGDAADKDGYIGYGVYVDFENMYDIASMYISNGNISEVLKIFQALFETIAEHMGWIDDSDGYYGEEFCRALESFTDCIKNTDIKEEDKKSYIRYLFEKYIEKDPDYLQQYYYYALKDICNKKDDLLYWKKLLRQYIPSFLPDDKEWIEYFQAREFIKMQLHILDLLGEKKDFYSLAKKFYKKDYKICNIYVDYLEKDGEIEQAIMVAERGINLFPLHLTIKMRRFLNKYCKDNSKKKYKENLMLLFILENKWNDYDALKELYPQKEWEKIIPVVIAKLLKEKPFSRDIVINIYLKEEMFDKALEKVLEEKSLYVLNNYHKDLSGRFPKDYFEAYKKLIIPFSGSRTGRAHYQEIVDYLKQMKEIKGFEKELLELADSLKKKYKNRPAFLDEMRRL